MMSTHATKMWVQTVHGHGIDLINPDLAELTIEEVAHSLARINRYTGHTRTPLGYTVAQHSVLVAEHLPPEFAFAGLVHDVHESILGDISSPVKMAIAALGGGEALKQLDEGLERAVRERWPDPCVNEIVRREAVKLADLRALVTERRDLCGNVEARPWGVDVQPWPEKITAWEPAHAEWEFLQLFRQLYEGD